MKWLTRGSLLLGALIVSGVILYPLGRWITSRSPAFDDKAKPAKHEEDRQKAARAMLEVGGRCEPGDEFWWDSFAKWVGDSRGGKTVNSLAINVHYFLYTPLPKVLADATADKTEKKLSCEDDTDCTAFHENFAKAAKIGGMGFRRTGDARVWGMMGNLIYMSTVGKCVKNDHDKAGYCSLRGREGASCNAEGKENFLTPLCREGTMCVYRRVPRPGLATGWACAGSCMRHEYVPYYDQGVCEKCLGGKHGYLDIPVAFAPQHPLVKAVGGNANYCYCGPRATADLKDAKTILKESAEGRFLLAGSQYCNGGTRTDWAVSSDRQETRLQKHREIHMCVGAQMKDLPEFIPPFIPPLEKRESPRDKDSGAEFEGFHSPIAKAWTEEERRLKALTPPPKGDPNIAKLDPQECIQRGGDAGLDAMLAYPKAKAPCRCQQPAWTHPDARNHFMGTVSVPMTIAQAKSNYRCPFVTTFSACRNLGGSPEPVPARAKEARGNHEMWTYCGCLKLEKDGSTRIARSDAPIDTDTTFSCPTQCSCRADWTPWRRESNGTMRRSARCTLQKLDPREAGVSQILLESPRPDSDPRCETTCRTLTQSKTGTEACAQTQILPPRN